MATEPDRIRTEIEATRAELATDVDRLADRTSPGRIAHRNWGRFTDRIHNLRERVMGTPSNGMDTVRRTADRTGGSLDSAAHSAADSVRDAAHSTAEAVREAPRTAAEQTRGNPLAAGLIAFGAGLLAAALIPASDAERRAAHRLAESTEGLREELREPLAESAARVKEDVTQGVRESVDEVTQTAKDAAQTTTDEAQRAAQRVKEDTTSATGRS